MSSAAAAASEVASKISSSASVHNTLSKIFGKKSTTSHKSNKKKTLKATSVILLPANYKTAPRGRKKEELRESGNFQSCFISPEDTSDMLSKKIISLFPSLSISGFKIMRATKSGDLFEAKLLYCTGEAILSLIGNGPLLLMPRAAVVTPIVSQAETHIAVYNETVLQTDTESEEASSEKYGMCMLFAIVLSLLHLYLPSR